MCILRPMAYKALTAEQRRTLEPLLEKIEQVQTEMETTMAEFRVRGSEDEEGMRCFRCSCEGFVAPRRGAFVCARPGCGHRFALHDVW